MARTELVITDTYQLASAVAATFTIKRAGKGTLFFNDTNADDDTAEAFVAGSAGKQIIQNQDRDTYVRAEDPSDENRWIIIVDEA